jgi:hypothetical protein
MRCDVDFERAPRQHAKHCCEPCESSAAAAAPMKSDAYGIDRCSNTGMCVNEGAGCYSPSSYKQKPLSKSKAEAHSHAKGPPTGAILFHNFFETDLSVVTTPNRFHKMLRTFTTEAPFFSVARHTPLFFFAKCCGLSLLRRHCFQYYPNNNWVIALL